MNTPINLNKVRKAKANAAAKQTAVQNRIAFGRTKEERQIEKHKQQAQTKHLDGHMRSKDPKNE